MSWPLSKHLYSKAEEMAQKLKSIIEIDWPGGLLEL